MFDLPNDGTYSLIPAVLHAYKVSTADLGNFVRPGSHGKKDKDGDDDNHDDERMMTS
jgi:hypothetical protein